MPGPQPVPRLLRCQGMIASRERVSATASYSAERPAAFRNEYRELVLAGRSNSWYSGQAVPGKAHAGARSFPITLFCRTNNHYHVLLVARKVHSFPHDTAVFIALLLFIILLYHVIDKYIFVCYTQYTYLKYNRYVY